MVDVVQISQEEQADRKSTILVVEDEVLVRSVVAEYLRDAGFTVVEAANAAEAMALIASQIPVDIVFTDIQMGEGPDGGFLADWIDTHAAGLPVLLTSGAFVARGKTGTRPFLPKPYVYLQLERRLRALFAQNPCPRPKSENTYPPCARCRVWN